MVFGNMGEMMKKVKDLKQIQETIKKESYEGDAGGVKVTISGDMELKVINIDPQSLKDQKRLEESVKDAVNQGLNRAKKSAMSKLGGLASGLNIPGLF